MSLAKRLLDARSTRVLTGVLLRLYRFACHGGFLFRHDERLHAVLRSRAPAIFACWHQDFLYTVGYLSRFNVRRRTYVLASASRDGGLAAAAAEAVGFRRAVRGSSARGGTAALLALNRLLAAGAASAVVVCDGPRPPARVLKPGVLQLARATGHPLWLVRTSYRPARVLERTWARFVLPPPWARAVALADGPIHVPANLGREALEDLRREVEGRLVRLAERADAVAAALPDWPRRPENRARGAVPPSG